MALPAEETPSFAIDPSVASFSVTPEAYLQAHPEFDAVAVGALVFRPALGGAAAASADDEPDPDRQRILLVQRAAHDSMPLRWEVPGGACDLGSDASILHSVARELCEESGLTMRVVGPRITLGVAGVGDSKGARPLRDIFGGETVFFTRRGARVIKHSFLVEVDDAEVRLDPDEHEQFVWATEKECVMGDVAGLKIRFTTAPQRATIMEGFRIRKELLGGKSGAAMTAPA